MTKGTAWTAEEDQFLLENPLISAAEASGAIHRTAAAIYDRRVKLRKAGASLPKVDKDNPNIVSARTLLARTCGDCGLLMDARWFRIYEPQGVYQRSCKRCVRKKRAHKKPKTEMEKRQTRAAVASYARITTDAAIRHRETWTEADYRVLMDEDLTLMEKALALGRTYTAVAQKAHAEQAKSKIGLGDPLKNEWAISNPNTIKETA